MLIEFRVENYRSFNDVQRMSMVAGSVRNHPDHVLDAHGMRVLSMSAIYGANSAGKSNIVRAMMDSRSKIVDDRPFPSGSWNRNDPANADRPSGFEYVISTDRANYAYGFEVVISTGAVTSEWLYDMTDGDVRIFQRDSDGISSERDGGSGVRERLNVVGDMIRPDSGDLALPLLARMDAEGEPFSAAADVMSWFRDSLVVVPAGGIVPVLPDADRDVHIGRSLRMYSTGITDMGYERLDSLPPGFPQKLLDSMDMGLRQGRKGMVMGPDGLLRLSYDGGLVVEKVVFYHDGRRFEFNEESDGTRRVYDLLPVTERGTPKGMTYVIDELDRSLHPLLTRRLVDDFLGMCQEARRQLIVTTHESGLMDMDILRRDEIWFVERSRTGDSVLYSLEEFRERGDRKVERSYMDGRYGAIPEFRDPDPVIQ